MDDNGSSVNLMVFRESTLLLIARSGNYDEACKFKWSKIKALLAAGSEFIAENEDWLLNGGD
ncbi:MAG: hypothetical protein INR73_29335, partial [Williamsia sp.]|nr:hypothetical protein [Williamsia sp.]